MNGFKRRTEQKKENIRQAAMRLFQTYGFNKVSIGDIAREAHVSHVTIYNHFGSKEELVRDIIKTIVYDFTDKSREIIDSDKPFLEKIKLLINNKTSIASQYQGEIMEMVARDYPEMKRFIDDFREKNINPLIDKLIEEGKKLKYIHPELSPQSVKYLFQLLRYGVYADKELREKINNDVKLLQDIYNLVLFGLIENKE